MLVKLKSIVNLNSKLSLMITSQKSTLNKVVFLQLLLEDKPDIANLASLLTTLYNQKFKFHTVNSN